MKLMTQFKDQLETLGTLKRVWMTSFNVSIDFIETHVLPAVLGIDPPRNRMDYETMQLALTEKGIDFRVYCDKRMLKPDQYKRTAISVLPVAIGSVPDFPGRNYKMSLFHPKVIYLEDENGNMVLGAGSANLTVGGWGRNQEVFDFRRVSNNEQYQQIKQFFSGIDKTTDLRTRRQFYADDHDWQFVHTFDRYSFLDYLMDYGDIRHLTVWSPYLADDLPSFIDKLATEFEQPELKVTLVPDRMEGRYIKTPWRAEIGRMMGEGRLEFCDNPSNRHKSCELTHAKVWMVKGSEGAAIAIGSWNFTSPGCSSLAGDNDTDAWSNVEAGILHSCGRSPKIVGSVFIPDEEDFASTEMLEKDKLDVPEALPFDLSVVFDWQTSAYHIDGQWNEGKPDNSYKLRAPAVEESLSLSWMPYKGALKAIDLFVEENEDLLADHFYQVLLDGEIVYQGLIIESGQKFRRSQGYSSLQELLNSYVSHTTPDDDDNVGLRDVLRNNDSPDEAAFDVVSESTIASVSYFRLFYAMREYRKRLDDIQNKDEFHKWLFSYPGCLQELVKRVSEYIVKSDAVVFNWFLANEVNTLYRQAVDLYARFRSPYSSKIPPEHQWKHLRVDVPVLPAGDGRREKYLQSIISECDYGTE